MFVNYTLLGKKNNKYCSSQALLENDESHFFIETHDPQPTDSKLILRAHFSTYISHESRGVEEQLRSIGKQKTKNCSDNKREAGSLFRQIICVIVYVCILYSDYIVSFR